MSTENGKRIISNFLPSKIFQDKRDFKNSVDEPFESFFPNLKRNFENVVVSFWNRILKFKTICELTLKIILNGRLFYPFNLGMKIEEIKF